MSDLGTWSDHYEPWIHPDDVESGDIQTQITCVELIEMNSFGRKEKKAVLTLSNHKKQLIVSKAMSRVLGAVVGKEIAKVVGKTVKISRSFDKDKWVLNLEVVSSPNEQAPTSNNNPEAQRYTNITQEQYDALPPETQAILAKGNNG